MEYECGCKAFVDPNVASLGDQIDFCPTHKAAPDMREALKGIVADLKNVIHPDVLEATLAALSKAEEK